MKRYADLIAVSIVVISCQWVHSQDTLAPDSEALQRVRKHQLLEIEGDHEIPLQFNILEARMLGDQPQWYYSFGSVGIFEVEVQHGGVTVWTEPRRTAQSTKPTEIYDGRGLALSDSILAASKS